MKRSIAALACLMPLLAAPAGALEPGSQVTVTLPDGSTVSGVVTSTAAPAASALPPLGFNTPPPSSTLQQPLGAMTPPRTNTYVGVGVVPLRPLSPAQKRQFLRRQEEERAERRHQATTPLSDWQFDLQQAIDRQAHGLPFNPPADRR